MYQYKHARRKLKSVRLLCKMYGETDTYLDLLFSSQEMNALVKLNLTGSYTAM